MTAIEDPERTISELLRFLRKVDGVSRPAD